MNERRREVEDFVNSCKEEYEGKGFDSISDSLYGFYNDSEEFYNGSDELIFTPDVKAFGILAGGGPNAYIGFFHNGYCEVIACYSGQQARISFYMDFDIQNFFTEGLL